MKVFSILVVLLLWGSTTCYSQLKLTEVVKVNPYPYGGHILRAAFPSKNTFYYINFLGGGMDTLFKTTDGGKSWTKLELPDEIFTERHSLIDINSLDTLCLYLATTPVESADSFPIYYTENAGVLWKKRFTAKLDVSPRIHFITNSVGFTHSVSTIHKTTDSAKTWRKVFGGFGLPWASFLDTEVGYVSGKDGDIIRTDDGGLNWRLQDKFEGNYINGFYRKAHFYNKDTIFFGVWNNFEWKAYILRSYNAGNLWLSQEIHASISDIKFINNKVAFGVGNSLDGDKDVIIKTIDCGNSWHIFKTQYKYGYRSITIVDDTTAYIYSDSAIHRLHLPSLTTNIAEKEPINKLQLVSYPNPTIDVITLEVLLETSTSINLQLIDLSGKVLENLDKGKKPQGKYTFSYNTQKLSPGSYMFRLETGGQVVTQKFIKTK